MKNLSFEKISELLNYSSGILGKEKYFNSAVLIPLFVRDERLHVLFEKRANQIRQGGEVSFPGGEYDREKDANLEVTAIRETSEELGIEKDRIRVLGRLGTLIAPMGVAVEAYVGSLNINSPQELRFDKTEVERIFSLPLDYFLNNKPDEYNLRLEVHPNDFDENGNLINLLPVSELGLPERYSKPWRKGRHKIFVYQTSEEIIWGITAELIFEFAGITGRGK